METHPHTRLERNRLHWRSINICRQRSNFCLIPLPQTSKRSIKLSVLCTRSSPRRSLPCITCGTKKSSPSTARPSVCASTPPNSRPAASCCCFSTAAAGCLRAWTPTIRFARRWPRQPAAGLPQSSTAAPLSFPSRSVWRTVTRQPRPFTPIPNSLACSPRISPSSATVPAAI